MLSRRSGKKEVISKLYVSDTMHWEDIKNQVWIKQKEQGSILDL